MTIKQGRVGLSAGAVFLSYASEDSEAVRRIAEALRAGGIEVWFDQNELRGGDTWDRKIREQIRECRLFIPVISANTERRDEGYFRREWTLAADRTRDMAHKRAFLVPVVIDGTAERGASVPEKFHELQWTRLAAGETSPEFVERVRRLLTPEVVAATAVARAGPARQATPAPSVSRSWSRAAVLWGAGALVAAALAYLVADKFWFSKLSPPPVPPPLPTAQQTVPAPGTATAFNPPPHSIAVLPFVNMSGDKEQEYFSEGLTEELLNSLARINELQVAARTSSFSFQGEHPDIATVAHKLNVGAVLEGSVRRSGHTIRVTTQLINAVTGFHVWSNTYDRDLKDVLKLQTEVAGAVAEALKVTLLGDVASKIEVGATHNSAAFDAYLRGSRLYQSRDADKQILDAIAAYTEAIDLDPNYALAFAGRSYAITTYSEADETEAARQERIGKAVVDARRAVDLAPKLAEAHLALAFVSEVGTLDFSLANEEYERAVSLAPGNAMALSNSARFAAEMGNFEAGIAAARRAVVLDPLGRISHSNLGRALYAARRYAEAVAAFAEVTTLNPKFIQNYEERGLAFYALGDLNSARASCEAEHDPTGSQCLAVAYHKLGRHADAEAELAKLKASGDTNAYLCAAVYAQWGDRVKALEWLDTAKRFRDVGLGSLKTDPLLDPVRGEPHFQSLQRALKFPE
jgi:TolB-like protein/Flp pilus assembly protein TadD